MMTLADQNIRHLKPIFHGDKKWMGLFYEHNKGLVSDIKRIECCKCLESRKMSRVPLNKMNIDRNSPLDNRNMSNRKGIFIYDIYAIWRICSRSLQARKRNIHPH